MQMTPLFPILGKLAYDANNLPPVNVRRQKFRDAFGNTFGMYLHKTPGTGIAVTALGPVGIVQDSLVTAGFEQEQVTTDISQSDANKAVGASMVALSIAETLAGYWTWVLEKGNVKDYMEGGRAVPLGDPTPAGAFQYASPYTPVATYKTDGNVVDAAGISWVADDTWGIAADDAARVICGVAHADDTSTAIAANLITMDCPSGYSFADAT